MLHKTAKERYEKLKRVFHRLMENFNSDDLDDYVHTANSLRGWINHDNTLMPEQKAHLSRFTVNQSLDWQICNQLANHLKHGDSNPRLRKGKTDPIPPITSVQVKPGGTGFVIQTKPGVTIQAKIDGGFIVHPNVAVYGAGEDIVIEVDGRRESALAFVIRNFQHFHYIFELAPVPLDQRVIPDLLDILRG
jgi:hypothetical protein